MSVGIVIIYITNPTRTVARKVARHLLDKRLIACANIFAVESMYRWKGKVMQEKEWVMIGKTTSAKANAVEKEVKKIHPYEVPCIMKIDAVANKEFERWVNEEMKR